MRKREREKKEEEEEEGGEDQTEFVWGISSVRIILSSSTQQQRRHNFTQYLIFRLPSTQHTITSSKK